MTLPEFKAYLEAKGVKGPIFDHVFAREALNVDHYSEVGRKEYEALRPIIEKAYRQGRVRSASLYEGIGPAEAHFPGETDR